VKPIESETEILKMKPLRKAVIHCFVFFFLLLIYCWGMPYPSLLRQQIRNTLSPVIQWSGLWQNWDMFAPTPRGLAAYVQAEVTFESGEKKMWDFPRVEKLGYLERFFKERYRKYTNDNLRLEQNDMLWPDAAKFVVYQNLQDLGNVPVRVELIRGWCEILPPVEGWVQPDMQHCMGPLQSYMFFDYPVPEHVTRGAGQ